MNKKFSVMRVISDKAVIQSGRENRIFGYAPEGSDVVLKITGGSPELTLGAKADENGRWEAVIPPVAPSLEKYTFTFTCGGESLTFGDICFGELFHISGQSNMELPMYRTRDPFCPRVFPVQEYIREFRVPIKCCFGKDEEYEDFPGGEWLEASERNVPDMSGAGFWFAYELFGKYGVPIGLLNTSAGGAPVEGRMPYKMLSGLGWYDDFLAECTNGNYIGRYEKYDAMRNEAREEELSELDGISDKIFSGKVSFKKCTVPFDFSDIPELNGKCGRFWFRKVFDIPEGADLTDAEIILGTLTDADKTYLNGKLIGETGYMYPPRNYILPEGAAVYGTNTLLVCLDVRYACGGFTKKKRRCLKLKDRLIDLSGEWGYAVAADIPVMEREKFFPGLPLATYAAMTAPAFNVSCRALIWYQGESDCNHPERYKLLFTKFVEMYRERLGEQIPVITTQLCNFDDPFAGGSDSWAELRFEQLKCLDIPDTDMAVTIDLGESTDLHPLNKKDVGKRLALCARRTLYGDENVPPDIFCTGARTEKPEGSELAVTLMFTDPGRLRLKDNAAGAFEMISGGERIPALCAEQTGDGVLLRFPGGKKAEKIRCEWRNDPETIALYDDRDIPLSPFETDVILK